MAYMSQEKKAAIAAKVKPILKKYKLKGSLSVHHHSTLILTIRQGEIDFIKNLNDAMFKKFQYRAEGSYMPASKSIDVNVYWYQEHFTGEALACLSELMPVLNEGNHDNSDSQSDYFDVGWYLNVKIGKWSQPYALVS